MASRQTQTGSSLPRRTPGHAARARLLKGHSTRSLAEAAGVSRATIIRAEAGTCTPTMRTAAAIARALGEPNIAAVYPQLADRTTSEVESKTSAVARIDVGILRRIRAALPADATELLEDVEHLIAVAEERP